MSAFAYASLPARDPCPLGVCNCEREALLTDPQQDRRILILTKAEEKKLIERIHSVQTLTELRHIQKRLYEQLGIQLHIEIDSEEIRSVKGLNIYTQDQIGLCAKTRKSIPAAVRLCCKNHPQIVYDLLDEQGLFATQSPSNP